VIKSRRIRWTGLVVCTGDLRKTDRLEALGVDGSRVLKWFSKKRDGGKRLIWLRTGTGRGML
jgi:hypothetical protein